MKTTLLQLTEKSVADQDTAATGMLVLGFGITCTQSAMNEWACASFG